MATGRRRAGQRAVIADRHSDAASDTQTALTGQVSSAEDVDMAATLSQLSLVQTQMQASYQLIAGLNSLSLAKFLPVS